MTSWMTIRNHKDNAFRKRIYFSENSEKFKNWIDLEL